MFAFLLAFSTFPALKSSPRNRIPALDWIFVVFGVAATVYLLVFYRQISLRPGLPTIPDIIISVIGVALLLEAARRAVGPALAVIACLMLIYIFAGPSLPGIMGHKGASLARVASQMWLSSEGIFGVALGVATTRPIVAAFFAARRLSPHEFFGTAFWLGFTLALLAAESWIHYSLRRIRRSYILFESRCGTVPGSVHLASLEPTAPQYAWLTKRGISALGHGPKGRIGNILRGNS